MPSLSANPEDVFTFWSAQRIGEAVTVDDIVENDSAVVHAISQEVLGNPAAGRISLTSSRRTSRIQRDGSPPSGYPRRVLYYPHSKEVSPACDSVGKLVVDDGTESGRCATAFYIGNSVVLTVAHAFRDQTFLATNDSKVAFIPGIFGPEEKMMPYGKFHAQMYEVHQGYVPGSAQYDICKVIIGTGTKNASVDDLKLLPFTLINNELLPKSQFSYKNVVCLGYPKIVEPSESSETKEKKKNEVDQPSYKDKLMGVRGVFSSYRTCSRSGLNVQGINILHGMSGGPWIFENTNTVLGIQAGNSIELNGFEISPRFTADLFRQLKIETTSLSGF